MRLILTFALEQLEPNERKLIVLHNNYQEHILGGIFFSSFGTL